MTSAAGSPCGLMESAHTSPAATGALSEGIGAGNAVRSIAAPARQRIPVVRQYTKLSPPGPAMSGQDRIVD